MATPLNTERYQRVKEAIESALRDGFDPWRKLNGGKGSSAAEAARRLTEAGFSENKSSVNDFLRLQEKWAAAGKDHWMPDWNLFAKPGVAAAQIKVGKIHRWILTAAQDDTDIHPRFWANLQAYANRLDAQLVVAGFTYQHARHTDQMTLTKTYRPEVRGYLRFEPMDCGPVLFCAEMNTLPTAVRPLSGLLTYSRGRDAIFPHAKHAYQTVPQMPGTYVPSLMTTGAVTVPNYIPKKAGQKAKFHHILGATIVEVNGNGEAWCRQIHAAHDGSFQDLDVKVNGGRITAGHRVKAVTWGDIHIPSVAEDVFDALWGRHANSLIDSLRPEYQFFHDLLSFDMWNRFVRNDPIHHAYMVFRGKSGMGGHIAEGTEFLRQSQREFCRSVVIESNHDQRLEQWTRTNCDRKDVENIMFWHECNLSLLSAGRNNDEDFNLFRWALRRADTQNLSGVDFVPVGGSFQICQEHGGIECGAHGHEGPNGSRGSAASLSKTAAKLNIAHVHSPEILDGVYVAGMTGDLNQGYNTGPSSWRRAHIVTYDNGKRTIVTQSESGAWRT